MPTETEVIAALRNVNDPELGRSLVDLNMIHNLTITPEGDISFTIALTTPGCPLRNSMAASARAAVNSLPGVTAVHTHFRGMSDAERSAATGKAHTPQLPKLNAFNQIKQVIAVMSGKGGVGKSSVTAALAVALMRKGQKVGILDADITGPSIPKLFGLYFDLVVEPGHLLTDDFCQVGIKTSCRKFQVGLRICAVSLNARPCFFCNVQHHCVLAERVNEHEFDPGVTGTQSSAVK